MSGLWRGRPGVEGFPGEGNGQSKRVGRERAGMERTTGEGPRGRAVSTGALGARDPPASG